MATVLVATIDHKFIAHIGLKRDAKFLNHVQISWDMFDTAYLEHYAEVTKAYRELLTDYLERAGTNIIYGFLISKEIFQRLL